MDYTANSFQTPSHYSASSSFHNYGANQASGSVFDSKVDDVPRAWCPQWPVKDESREWLQLDFDNLKVINILITWGLSSSPDHFVPFFFLRYERGDGFWHDFISHNGTKLIVANHDSAQPKTISLSPHITTRRLRIIPYRKDYSQSMCLKVSVLGYAFNASLLSYEIPEGDVYQSPVEDQAWAALNDSTYDGIRLSKFRNFSDRNPQNHLTDGLGVLVDRRVYSGGGIRKALKPPFYTRNMPWDSHQTLSGLVGWFCRAGLPLSPLSPPCRSRNVSLLFIFDSVRLFTELRIHSLNSFAEDIAVFREAVVHFSVGGKYFDCYAPPVLYSHPRNISSSQPTWVSISLPERVARFVRIVLIFDSDWIILSEVAFISTSLMGDVDVEKNDQFAHTSFPQLQSPPKSAVSVVRPSNQQVEASTSHFPKVQPPLLEDSNELSFIISSVCMVGLVLVISVFVCVLCRLCRSRSYANRALLSKTTTDRGPQGGDCSDGGGNGRKSRRTESNNRLVASADGRLLSLSGTVPTNAFCLASTIASSDILSPNKPTPMYSPFNSNDEMLETLHQMQQNQSQISTNDPSFRPMIQPALGFGKLSASSGAPHLVVESTTAAPFFQLPPPPLTSDQPLLPFHSVTPTSSVSCGTRRPSSTVNPYAACSAVYTLANSGSAVTAPMMANTHMDCSMAEYASASLISSQTGYSRRPPSIHGSTGGFIFAPKSTIYPTPQSLIRQDVLFQPTTMLVSPNGPGNAANGNGFLPLIVSCCNGFGGNTAPFDSLKPVDTIAARGDAYNN